MNAHLIERHFAKIGARAKVYPETRRDRTGVKIDIGHDGEGEFFDIALAQPRLAEVPVVDTQPRIRHPLLMCERADGKHKFLCGHDERHWFVAAVPHPQRLTEMQHRRLISRNPKLRNLQWVVQRRNPLVFVRGKVRHADHKTIVLDGWHQVLMNTETQSVAMRHVAFID